MIWRRHVLALAGATIGLGWPAAAADPPFAAIPPARAAALARLPRDLSGPIVRRATAAIDKPPAAVARFHVEGGFAGRPDYDAGQIAQRDLASMRDLALAWRIAGEARFLDAFVRRADAWTAIYRVSLNPIDEECFERVILAGDLTRGALPTATQAGIDRLTRDLAAGYLDFIEASRTRKTLRGTDINNWNSHRVKIATLAAYATGDAALIVRARAAFDLQIARNIAADGAVVDFTERDALHYVVYSLLPLLTACAAAAAHGESWIDRAVAPGGTVRQGLAWLMPYVEGVKSHEEFVHSKVRFDAERAAAGVAGFAGRWQRDHALDLIALAAHLDPAYRPVLDSLARDTKRQANDWLRALFPAV